MSVAEIRRLPLDQKLEIMEALWEDLRSHVQQSPVPDWHKNTLDQRRKALEEGREKVLNWDDVKNQIGRRTE